MVEQAVIIMYQKGMSTREIVKFVELILVERYSIATISNITAAKMDDIRIWRERPLHKLYVTLYLDAMFVIKVRRDILAKETVYFALVVDEQGYREILGIYLGGQESASSWSDVFHKAYLLADVQRYVVHKVRNTLNKARERDQ